MEGHSSPHHPLGKLLRAEAELAVLVASHARSRLLLPLYPPALAPLLNSTIWLVSLRLNEKLSQAGRCRLQSSIVSGLPSPIRPVSSYLRKSSAVAPTKADRMVACLPASGLELLKSGHNCPGARTAQNHVQLSYILMTTRSRWISTR